ncbi:EthD family reductase [Amycolatopsis benzoatilytica]|uniref:EthD family reductase n=1 Tax=Amycolatopsis benzoatilytica TaxID=346045 RepID=UPI000379D719|nr:EthD family reductase [Amycolatopsis benzoatilytica]
MHILTVAYGHPSDPAAFDEHYARTHRPLVEKVPELAGFSARRCAALDGGEPPYYLLAELSFRSAEALAAGLSSPEGQAAAADLDNFADGGATMFVQYD